LHSISLIIHHRHKSRNKQYKASNRFSRNTEEEDDKCNPASKLALEHAKAHQ